MIYCSHLVAIRCEVTTTFGDVTDGFAARTAEKSYNPLWQLAEDGHERAMRHVKTFPC
jgi:hypothetical protein